MSQINLLITEGTRQIVVDVSHKFNVEERENFKEIHIADALHALVYNKLKEQNLATLKPAKYQVNMLLTFTDMSEVSDEVQESEDK